MTQRDLNRAVARATGESVDMIEQMGFGELHESTGERQPNSIDWDEHDDARLAVGAVRRRRLAAAV
ncbi:MAG: hypothetical protein HY290_23695 [Planctomycetia bacterium]|nr:hypothetical protein [Planctomycetia bacterium]